MRPTFPIVLALLLAACAATYTPDTIRVADTDELRSELRHAAASGGPCAALREELLRRLPYADATAWGEAVRAGRIEEGMTLEAVMASWGRPDSRRGENTPLGAFAHWQYGRTSVSFTDGRVRWWSQETW